MYGIVVLIELSSRSNASHSVLFTAHVAVDFISTIPLYVAIHQSLEIDLETIVDDVFFQI